MPATSKSQQRLFGMVHAYKEGKLDTSSIDSDLLAKVKEIAGGIKSKSAKDFAETKHKGLPARVSEDFETANKKEHPVETQWHYPMMTDAGFEAVTKSGTGFVRSYDYEKGDHKVTVTTGANADHWEDKTTGKNGYWGTLEKHLKTLNEESPELKESKQLKSGTVVRIGHKSKTNVDDIAKRYFGRKGKIVSYFDQYPGEPPIYKVKVPNRKEPLNLYMDEFEVLKETKYQLTFKEYLIETRHSQYAQQKRSRSSAQTPPNKLLPIVQRVYHTIKQNKGEVDFNEFKEKLSALGPSGLSKEGVEQLLRIPRIAEVIAELPFAQRGGDNIRRRNTGQKDPWGHVKVSRDERRSARQKPKARDYFS